MRAVLLAAVCGLVGCGKKMAETPTAGGNDPPKATADAGPARDYAEFVAELRKTVPVRVDEFRAKGLKCDPYVTSKLVNIEIFDSLTLTLDPPVALKDSLTGKTQTYVGAKMVRAGSGDVFATGSTPEAEASRKNGGAPIVWDKVQLVPAPKDATAR